MKFGSLLAAMISTSLLAQQATNAPAAGPIETPGPAAPITSTPEPAAKPAPPKKAPAKRPARKAPNPAELRTVPLVPGPAIVVANHVNVRGAAGLIGEVLTRMSKGEQVTVIEEVTLKRSGPDEPSAWAKILLPQKTHPWVKATFIDPETKTVKASELNLRGGPGENYSILGKLQRGDTVTELKRKEDWIQIQAPNAHAFMAAQYLSQEPAILAAAGVPGVTAPEGPATEVPETTPVQPTAATPEVGMPTAETPGATTTEPAIPEEPEPRIVQREGFVRPTLSIQAPTVYELISPDTRKPINFLHTTSTNLDLSRYKGLHIIVTGEEGLDRRWRNTPVLTIHRIQVLD